MFSALAFFLLLPLLKRTETISLDTDWFYRKGGRAFYWLCDKSLNGLNDWSQKWLAQYVPGLLTRYFEEPGGNVQKYGIRMVAEAAYLRAEKRHFATGGETDDWLAAEAEVDARLAAEGVKFSD